MQRLSGDCGSGISASFGSDVMKIASGTVIAQVLTMAASPIVARMYGPEAFGLLALFVALAGIVGVVACLRYEYAIMLPEDDGDAANLLALSLALVSVMSVLAVPAVLLGHDRIALLLNQPEISGYLWLVPPYIFVNGVFLALNQWNSRTKRFSRLSVARVTSSASTAGIQLSAGASGFAAGGSLIGAGIAGSAASTLVLGAQIWRDDGEALRSSIRLDRILSGIRRYRKFPLIDSWSSLLNAVSWQLPTFLLSAFFSSAVVGYYALGMNILQMPMALIGSAISQVFFQRAASAKVDGTLSSVIESTFLRLGMVGVFPILLLAFTGREVFITAFGPGWAEAGVYVQILALWTFFVFITSPICTLFSVLEMQGRFLAFNAGLFIARAGALIVGGLSGDPRVALALFSLVGVAAWGGLCIWLLRKTGVPAGRISRSYGRYLAFSSPLLLIAALRWLGLVDPLQEFTLLSLASVCYYCAVIWNDESLRPVLQSLVMRINKYE